MSRVICITGAAGQVGQLVTRAALAKGYNVLGLDLPAQSNVKASSSYSYVQSDVCNVDTLHDLVKSHKCDAVIHMAAVLNNPNRTTPGRTYSEHVCQ